LTFNNDLNIIDGNYYLKENAIRMNRNHLKKRPLE